MGVRLGQAWLGLRFFWLWGTFFGTLLGFITGSLIFPILGTLYATAWGFGLGFSLGLAAGLIAAIKAMITPIDLENVKAYRRGLSLSFGIFIALAAGLLFHISTKDILWGNSYSGIGEFSPYYLPSILSAILWGGLAAAYTAHRFAEHCARFIPLREWREYQPAILGYPDGVTGYWVGHFMGRWSIYPVMAVAGGLIGQHMQSGYTKSASTSIFLSGMIVGLLYAAFAALLVGAVNGLMLTFVNRICFHEYFPDMPKEHYQRISGRLAGFFTFGIGVMMAFGLLAPQPGYLLSSALAQQALIVALLAAAFAGITASMIAREFSERYFEAQERRSRQSAEPTNRGTAVVPYDTRAKVVHRHIDPDSAVSSQLLAQLPEKRKQSKTKMSPQDRLTQ